MLREFSAPAPLSICKAARRPNLSSRFVVGTLSDFVAASNVRAQGFHGGDLTHVAASDKYMAKLEALFPAPTARHEWTDDVVGGFANVPAYIAGQPLNMRRKIKREHEASPIAIVLDTTSSGGISNHDYTQRGIMALALTRALSARRPVELYVASGLGTYDNNAIFQFYQLDTAPLDLARAAYCLCDANAARAGFYGFARQGGRNSVGSWPYNNFGAFRPNFRDVIKQALPHIDDVVAMPGVHLHDNEYKNPLAWVEKHIKAFGDVELEDA